MKKILTIIIEDPIVVSLNIYRTSHWTKQTKIRDDQYLQLHDSLKSIQSTSKHLNSKSNSKLPLIKKYPIRIEYILEKPRPYDCSNIITKYWEDALVQYNIIENDSPKFVEAITLISKASKEKKLTMRLYQ